MIWIPKNFPNLRKVKKKASKSEKYKEFHTETHYNQNVQRRRQGRNLKTAKVTHHTQEILNKIMRGCHNLQARRKMDDIKWWKKKILTKSYIHGNLPFKNEGEIKTFLNKQKMRWVSLLLLYLPWDKC